MKQLKQSKKKRSQSKFEIEKIRHRRPVVVRRGDRNHARNCALKGSEPTNNKISAAGTDESCSMTVYFSRERRRETNKPKSTLLI